MKVWYAVSAKIEGGCPCCDSSPELEIFICPDKASAMSEGTFWVEGVLDKDFAYKASLIYPDTRYQRKAYKDWYTKNGKWAKKVADFMGWNPPPEPKTK